MATSALLLAGAFGGGAVAEAAPPYEQAHFSVASLFPNYAPQVHDYVVRCNDGPVTVDAHASGVWRMAIGDGPFRSGDFNQVVLLGAGRAFTVRARQVGRPEVYRYHVRCLPNEFPGAIEQSPSPRARFRRRTAPGNGCDVLAGMRLTRRR
jgi:hypothetical protein